MAITHATAVRNGLADYIDDQVNVGTNPGTLVFQTSGDVEVATCTFSATAFGAATNGVITANAISDDINATGGTVTKFRIYNGDITPAEVLSGTVTATGGGGDIELSSTTIGAGDTVSITSLTYEASA